MLRLNRLTKFGLTVHQCVCQITVLGTPAEEDGGGKIDLIQAGAFADMDVVFMAHPAQEDKAFHPCIAITE